MANPSGIRLGSLRYDEGSPVDALGLIPRHTNLSLVGFFMIFQIFVSRPWFNSDGIRH